MDAVSPRQIKERPIIFSAAMVRAILEGRKTQTRRIIKPQPAEDIRPHIFPNPSVQGWISSRPHKFGSSTAHTCPYGQPGDRLWVRETWGEGCHPICCNRPQPILEEGPHGEAVALGETCCGCPNPEPHVAYKADGPDDSVSRWRPSIHMPRWASRIALEIVSVRVERLQEIGESDAQAEGIERLKSGRGWYDPNISKSAVHLGHYFGSARAAFESLWLDINGSESWDANPWVWVIEFKRVDA